MQKKTRRKRRGMRFMAGMTGALLLTAGMMNHHAPTAKAAPQWETMLPDNLGDVWEKSRENIEQRVRESIRDNINKKIEEKKDEWGREILERIAAPAVSRANKVIDNVQATAYTSGSEDNGIWNDRTHIGTKVRPGIIAVDPNVIPLGTQVYIEFADGRGMYAVAEDTGGSIKGRRIDIALSDSHKVREFGIQPVRVHILEEGGSNLA